MYSLSLMTLPDKAKNYLRRPPVFVQPKLEINAPGDKYEREADTMADRVMRITNNSAGGSAVSSMIGPSVQRKCGACEQEEKPLMRKAGNIAGQGVQASSSLVSSLGNSKGGGSQLPPGTRNFMENAFSTDFSGVRVHTDSQASNMNNGINARAFTHGSDIYFKNGEFAPGNNEGKKLLAHELAHVIQQIPAGRIRRKTYLEGQGITDGTILGNQSDVAKNVLATLALSSGKLYPYIKDKTAKLTKKVNNMSIDSPAVFGHKYRTINNITDPTVTDDNVFDTVKGFVDPKKDDIYLANRSNYCHAFHESLHTISFHTSFSSNFGHEMMEGLTQYFTDVVFTEQTGGVCTTHSYQKELACGTEFVKTVGFDVAASVLFDGKFNLLMPIINKLNFKTTGELRDYILKKC